MLPTLQQPFHQEALMAALINGTIDFVASDHAPHLPEEKQVDDAWQCPGGTPGLDTLAPSVLDLACRGVIRLPRVAELLARAPATLFGLGGRKGALEVGLDADLVLVDPDARREITPQSIRSRAARSPFEGKTLQGWPVLTVLRGAIIAEHGALTVTKPGGQHIVRIGNVQGASSSR
jgi:dihydroorotase-like cyclic amidohydrolase